MVSRAITQCSSISLPTGADALTELAPNEETTRVRSQAQIKASESWQGALWRRWPRGDCWPAKLDIYEAAAYLRVSPDTIRRALIVARDGRARLAHQRLGATYRIRKADLDTFGSVEGRSVAA